MSTETTSSNRKKMGYSTDGYVMESSGLTSSSTSGADVGSYQSEGGFSGITDSGGYDISKEYKMETVVMPFGAFLIEESGKKYLIPGIKNPIADSAQSQVSGMKILPNANIQKCGFQDKEPILVGCTLSKALLEQYLNKYYSGDTNISNSIEKLIAAGLLRVNVQIQTTESNSAALDLLVVGIDSSCPNEFIGINAASILATKTNIQIVAMKGNTTVVLSSNVFPWNNLKDDKIDGYTGTLLLEQTPTDAGAAGQASGDTTSNNIDTVTYKSYNYTSNINNSNLLARVKIYVLENSNTVNVFTSDNKEIFNRGSVSGSWEVLGTASAGAWTGDRGNLTEKEWFYATKEVKITHVKYDTPVYTQQQIRTNKTEYGSPMLDGTASLNKLVNPQIPPNYPITIAGARGHLKCHPLVKARIENIMKDIINHYGSDIKEVAPAACIWNCCHRGNRAGSLHAYGIAVDIDASHNGMDSGGPWNASNSRLCTNPVYLPLFKIFAAHGFFNLGTHWGKDYMHFQCATWTSDTRPDGNWQGQYFKAPSSTKKYK